VHYDPALIPCPRQFIPAQEAELLPPNLDAALTAAEASGDLGQGDAQIIPESREGFPLLR
jgi:hypothetical protein